MSDVQTFDPEVEQRLEQVTERFNQFVARRKTEIIKAKESYTTKVKQVRNEHRDLLKQINDAIKREAELETQIEHEIADANTSESRVAELRLKERQLADERKTLEKQVVELKKRVEERRVELSKLKENQQRQGEMDLPEAMVFEQLLGFKIEGLEEDLLRFVFTNIDSQSPKKDYVVDLDVSGTEYNVVSLQPGLPEAEVQEIVAQLNQTRDLTHFLKSIRSAFKKL